MADHLPGSRSTSCTHPIALSERVNEPGPTDWEGRPHPDRPRGSPQGSEPTDLRISGRTASCPLRFGDTGKGERSLRRRDYDVPFQTPPSRKGTSYPVQPRRPGMPGSVPALTSTRPRGDHLPGGSSPDPICFQSVRARPASERGELRLEFRILGPLEVTIPSGPVEVSGKKRRALLMRLLLAANQPVPDDRLAFDLWVGTPPAGGASTLASHVSLLRKAIGSERIRHHGGGYSLVMHPPELDSAEFESDVVAGREALRQGRPLVAADRFERGLQRWQGSALAEVDGVMWAQGAIARLEELRLGAVESLLDVRLSLGQHREIVAAAEASVQEHPLRERGWAILMTALYRSGRQAEALRSYQRLRTHLAEQLGVEPSRELADLEESMILQSPDLRWPSGSPSTSSETRPETSRTDVCTVLVARTRSQGGGPEPTEPDGCAPRLADIVALHDGRSIRVDSDDLVALFDSPADAMTASAALQIECTTFHDHHGLRIARHRPFSHSLDLLGCGGMRVRPASEDVVNLGARRRGRLEALVRRSSAPPRLVLRARIVPSAAQGHANAQSARELAIGVDTVRTWRQRFCCGGMPGLNDRPRPGIPPQQNRRRHVRTVSTPMASSRAIWALAWPCAADSTILARRTRRCGADDRRTSASSRPRRRAPKLTTSSLAGRTRIPPHPRRSRRSRECEDGR